ncbi:MAG: virulence RhuM family protein [Clostridiales bacterium]|nr:virulence RhuM family protein [Clostridiales bacterium]
MKNEIVLYRPNELAEHIEVRFDEDTAWLTQAQIAELFGTKSQAITKHINNIYSTRELDKASTCSILEQVRHEGNRSVKRSLAHYNLDVIISVGYRVNSINATIFRRWATKILRDYLLKGYAINNRMDRIEDNVEALKNRVDEIDLQINTHLIPTQGVFFDGQVFDAYELASKIIRSATQSIVLIDNYINENTLTHLAKKQHGVKALLLTRTISKQLSLDVQKADAQYGDFDVKQFTLSHDRFLIIDGGKELYHIGASLKDLGKKWFAFSKMEKISVASIINAVSGLI